MLKQINKWHIGSTPKLKARVTAGSGSGALTGVAGEGKYITSADVSTIVAKYYDRSSSNPASATSITITSSAVIAATTSDAEWDVDAVGHNFSFTMPAATTGAFTSGHNIRVTVDITLTDGTVLGTMAWEGPAEDLSP